MVKRESPKLTAVSGGALSRDAQMPQGTQNDQTCKRVPSGLCQEFLHLSLLRSLEGSEVGEITLLAGVVAFS